MSEPRFCFVGGKGGVGKTTVASAFGVRLADAGLETLLVSTDPAHSTRDVFEQDFDDEPRPVDGRERLSVLEIDPEREVEAHLQGLRRALGEQLSPVLVNEVEAQLELAHRTPGAYEAALFDRFIAVMREADAYDRVVFDTSPTGSTLRLLALPDLLEAWIDRLLAKREESIDLYERAAIGGKTPRRVREGDPIVARLEERRERFAFAREVLRDDAAFVLVVTPDRLSVRETDRSIETLAAYDLAVDGLVVNRVTPWPGTEERGRGAAFLRRRGVAERRRVRQIRESLAPRVLAELETYAGEVSGDALAAVADDLTVPTLAAERPGA